MRTFDEITADILQAASVADGAAVKKYADEMRGLGTPEAKARAEHSLGNASYLTGELASALEHYQRAVTEYETLGDRAGAARIVGNMGLIYSGTGDYPRALEHFRRSIAAYEELGLAANIANDTGNIGIVYMSTGEYPLAVEYYRRALALHEESGDRHAEARILGNLGNVYAKTEEFDRAIGYLQRALDLHEQHGDAFGVAGVTGSLISVLINTKRFDEAAKMLDKQASMSASMENPMVSSMHEAHRGDIAQHMGELDDTWRHLQRAVEIATQAGMRSEAAEFHRRLRDLAKQRNDFEGYIHHNDEYQRITEEVRGKEATQRMTMMEAERKMEGERRERERERAVLYSTLPRHVADRVIRGEEVTDHFTNAAVFFSDVVSFTSNSSEMSAPDVVRLLESMFKTFDELCAEHGITKVKTIGDAYLCFKGDEGGSGNALAIAQFALAVQRAAFMWPSGQPLTLRIGLHIGPATAGVIGTERLQYDIWGDTVNVASRMESTGEPGRIHVSDVFVLALANESFDLQRRGDVEVKGKGLMTTYWLEGAD